MDEQRKTRAGNKIYYVYCRFGLRDWVGKRRLFIESLRSILESVGMEHLWSTWDGTTP